jgi:hypothetical protein
MFSSLSFAFYKSSTGVASSAMSQFLFKNEGGVLTVDGLTIENVVIDTLFAIENNGVGRIENTRVTGSTAMVCFFWFFWLICLCV